MILENLFTMHPNKMINILPIITAVLTALIAGLFYAYSCSVNPGLRRLPAREYLAAMQSINDAIQNPVFFASFFGAAIMIPLNTWLQFKAPGDHPRALLFAAALIYLIGVFGVTIAANVPINNGLANFDLNTASADMINQQRTQFEKPWIFWHNIRTIAAVVSLILVLINIKLAD